VPITREITGIRGKVAAMGEIMSGMLHQALSALRLQDREAALEVVGRDAAVDALETEIEDMCLAFLARYAPKAFDLRYVVAMTRLVSDMERIADNSVAICRESISRHLAPILAGLKGFSEMAVLTASMVDRSVAGVLAVDSAVQPGIVQDDRRVGDYQRDLHQALVVRLSADPDSAPEIVSLVGVVRRVERIASHARNMAVMIPYIAEGSLPSRRDDDEAAEAGAGDGASGTAGAGARDGAAGTAGAGARDGAAGTAGAGAGASENARAGAGAGEGRGEGPR
jgi:phosphate transport system protein